MSECLHLHDTEGQHIGDICVPGPRQYLPRLHRTGAHTWEPIGEPVATIAEAFTVLGAALEDARRLRWRPESGAGAMDMDVFRGVAVDLEGRERIGFANHGRPLLADEGGWDLVYHTHDSRRSPSGFVPDWIKRGAQ